jgi:hypothetical protein
MPPIPAKSDITGVPKAKGSFRSGLDALHDYLTGLLGSDGNAATAVSVLGLPSVANIATTQTTQTLENKTLLAVSGSAAAPSLSFESDTDTGLFRQGADALGIATNATERVRITNSGMQVTGLLTGTAVTQSETDNTANRLLKVGDFGGVGRAGQPPATPAANVDAFDMPNGWYRFNNTTSGTLPPDIGSAFAIIQNWWRSNNSIFQMAVIQRFSPDRIAIFVRNSLGNPASSWMPWRRVYNQEDIIGTVSQSGGVPTGGIFQGNASAASPTGGYAQRDASGFQTAHHVLNSSASADVTWTYNLAFLSGSTPAISIQPVGAGLRPELISVSATAATFSVRDVSTGDRVAVSTHVIARGRWSNMT